MGTARVARRFAGPPAGRSALRRAGPCLAAVLVFLPCRRLDAMGFVYDARDLGMGGPSSALPGTGRVAWNPAAARDAAWSPGRGSGGEWSLTCATFSRYEDGEPRPALSGVAYVATMGLLTISSVGEVVDPVVPVYPVTHVAWIWEIDMVSTRQVPAPAAGFFVLSTPFKRESKYDALDALGSPVQVTLEQRMGQIGGGAAWSRERTSVGAGVYLVYSDVEAEASNGNWIDDNIVGATANVGVMASAPLPGRAWLTLGAAYHTGGRLSRDNLDDDPDWTSAVLIGDHAYWAWDDMDPDRDGVLEGWPSVLTAGAALETPEATFVCELTRIDWSRAEPSWRAVTGFSAGIEWDLDRGSRPGAGASFSFGYRYVGSPTARAGLPEDIPRLHAFTTGFGADYGDDCRFDLALEIGRARNLAVSWSGSF